MNEIPLFAQALFDSDYGCPTLCQIRINMTTTSDNLPMKKLKNDQNLLKLMPVELWIQVDGFTDLKTHTSLRASCSFMRTWLPHGKEVEYKEYRRLWEAVKSRYRATNSFKEAVNLCTQPLTQDHYNYLCKNYLKDEVLRICELALSPPFSCSHIDLTAADNNFAIRWSSKNGHSSIVDLLLQDSRVDPAADNNFSIRWASENGHSSVAGLLLQDSRVDPTASDNYAIKRASENGHSSVVKLLLQDSRVDPAADNNLAIRFASRCCRCNQEMATLLL